MQYLFILVLCSGSKFTARALLMQKWRHRKLHTTVHIRLEQPLIGMQHILQFYRESCYVGALYSLEIFPFYSVMLWSFSEILILDT